MPIKRDVKTLASRLDRHYIDRRSAVRRVRIALVVLCLAAAAGWYAFASRGDTTGELYNPGHVTAVHASFEHDCRACHDGNSKGGFLMSVSDNACIKCHDGSIHHENQKKAAPNDEIHRGGNVLAVSDANHTAGMRSASCVSCHTEHRGEALMKGTSDANCTQCHTNLKDSTIENPHRAQGAEKFAPIANEVVAFTEAGHPAFGRELMEKDGDTTRPFDPTKLRYNQRKHASVRGLEGDNSCIKCHETLSPSPAAKQPADPSKQNAPPFALPGDAPTHWANQADQRYIQPISFDRHCASCHQIKVNPVSIPAAAVAATTGPAAAPARPGRPAARPGAPGGGAGKNEPLLAEAVVPHVSMDGVRIFAAGQVASALTAKNLPDAKARDELLGRAVEKLVTDLSKQKLRDDAWEGPAADLKQAAVGPDALANLYTHAIATAASGCVSCHSLQQQEGRIETTPTQIPDGPRVWYAGSVFDHRKHRNMSCVECHSTLSEAYLAKHASADTLPQAEATSFFNSPNLTWTQTVKDGTAFKDVTRSCVECHHKDNTGGQARGVASNCVSCHNFHDRSKENRPSVAAHP
jgi:hypothetical protein